MIKNFYVIEKRLNGGSIYFAKEDTEDGDHYFTNEITEAKQYENKIDAVQARSDLGLVSRTTVEEHQLEFTSVEKTV